MNVDARAAMERRPRPSGIARIFLLSIWLAGAALAAEVPVAVSPGEPSQLMEIVDACPTFSWGEVEGAQGYELVVYRLRDEGVGSVPVLRQVFQGSVDGWTPSLDHCLEPGGEFAWSVRVVGLDKASDWSRPNLFRVATSQLASELRVALEVVRRYLQAQEAVSLPVDSTAEAETLSAIASALETVRPLPGTRAVAETKLNVDGGIEAISFTGDGSTLAALDPANIAPGIAPISVTGSSASLNCVGCVASITIGDGQVKSGDIGNGEVSGADIDPSTVQARVVGSCPDDQVIRAIGSDGSVACEANTRVLPGSEYFVSNFNGGVSATVAARANRLCFLTYVSFRDVDGTTEDASCLIELNTDLGPPTWVLYAASENDSDARCGMRCIEITPNRTF